MMQLFMPAEIAKAFENSEKNETDAVPTAFWFFYTRMVKTCSGAVATFAVARLTID